MTFSDFIIYADESGDHSLTSIDADYPVFVLTFCIFKKEDYATSVSPALQRFKFKHFGHDIVVLHEHAMRKQKPPFEFLKHKALHASFMDGLSDIIDATPMTIIASVIKKKDHVVQYAQANNPYQIALLFCMERTFQFLTEQGQGKRVTHIVFESRGKKEDRDLELEFRRIRDGANWWRVNFDCLDICFANKQVNSAGLQLADMTARPIGLRVLRPNQPNRAHDIIRKKLRRSPGGRTAGWGFKVFP